MEIDSTHTLTIYIWYFQGIEKKDLKNNLLYLNQVFIEEINRVNLDP